LSQKSVMDVDAKDWEDKVLKSKMLVLVNFWHEHCPWCKMLDPIYNEVSKEYSGKIKFAKFNVLKSDENREIAIRYGIMSTPTLMFFCDGRPIEGIMGFMPKEHLKHVIEDVTGKYQECLEKSTKLAAKP